MLLSIKERKRQIIAKGISLIIGGLGLYTLWTVWLPIITKYCFESFSDIIFLFIFPVPVTCIAIYFFYTAKILWTGLSSKGVCKLAVSLSIIFAGLLLGRIGDIALTLLDKSVWSIIEAPFIMIMAGFFYLLAKKGMFGLFSIQQEYDMKAHHRATKLYFGFLAFIIWSSVSNIVDLLPRDPDHEYVPDKRWLTGLILFGSILLAFLIYRIGIKIFLKKPCAQIIPDCTSSAKNECHKSL